MAQIRTTLIPRPLAATALVVLGACAGAPERRVDPVRLSGPAIVRNAPDAGPEAQVAAYVRLRNHTGANDRLVGLSCACAAIAEIHATRDGDMHVLEHLDLPSRGELEIRPGGPTHLMLIGLKAPIAPGDIARITLRFERAGEVAIDFTAVENSREGWDAREGS